MERNCRFQYFGHRPLSRSDLLSLEMITISLHGSSLPLYILCLNYYNRTYAVHPMSICMYVCIYICINVSRYVCVVRSSILIELTYNTDTRQTVYGEFFIGNTRDQ